MDSDKPPVQITQRLFLALWPDDDVRRQLTAHAGEWTRPGRCVKSPPEGWHLTLHFIGNVGHDQMATLPAAAVSPTTSPGVVWRARDYVLAASAGASSPRYQLIHRYE